MAVDQLALSPVPPNDSVHSIRSKKGEQIMRIQTPVKTNVMKTFWQISFCLVLLFCSSAVGHAQAWQARHGMTSAQYQSEFNNLTSQGYRLTYVSGYTENNQERFAAIWEEIKLSTPPFGSRKPGRRG
jgi:hypothetical protein